MKSYCRALTIARAIIFMPGGSHDAVYTGGGGYKTCGTKVFSSGHGQSAIELM